MELNYCIQIQNHLFTILPEEPFVLLIELAFKKASSKKQSGPPPHRIYFCRGPLPTHFIVCFPLCPPQDLKWNSPYSTGSFFFISSESPPLQSLMVITLCV